MLDKWQCKIWSVRRRLLSALFAQARHCTSIVDQYIDIGKNLTMSGDLRILIPSCTVKQKIETRSPRSLDKVIFYTAIFVFDVLILHIYA